MSLLSKPYFHDETAAYTFVEGKLWPSGPVCPRCGGKDRIGTLKGESVRRGVYKCYACRKPFTVKVGTIFESSHLPLNLWLQAIFLMVASKKGVSSLQLSRVLGITPKSAWFLSHRIRESMAAGQIGFFGSGGGAVEVDETFIGRDFGKKPKGQKKGRGYEHKSKVLSLVDRESGQARSMVIPDLKAKTILPLLEQHIDESARVMTDEAGQYKGLSQVFAFHGYTRHGMKEYVSMDDRSIHTNTVEGFFSIFKRGMKGVYQHCRHRHLSRYLAEFDFRYNHRAALGIDDVQRFDRLLTQVGGKRLTYRALCSRPS